MVQIKAPYLHTSEKEIPYFLNKDVYCRQNWKEKENI